MDRTLGQSEALIALWSDGVASELGPVIHKLAAATETQIDRDGDASGRAAAGHSLWHALASINAIRRERADQVATQHGSVVQVSRSDGGVPKLPIARAEVDRHGVVGDTQAARVHHGRPWQALCLWSDEVIGELVAEGHPVAPGATGENVTISGIDWASLRAGTILDIGTVRCQLSAPATPCAKNRRWFLDGAIERMDHDRNPGSSRWYATVLRAGVISTGDMVVVEPTERHVQTVGRPA